MPIRWDSSADALLFANVLEFFVSKVDYDILAKAQGYGVSAKAVSHRINKIKERAEAYRNSGNKYFPTNGSSSKSKVAKARRPRRIAKDKQGKIFEPMDDDEDVKVKKEELLKQFYSEINAENVEGDVRVKREERLRKFYFGKRAEKVEEGVKDKREKLLRFNPKTKTEKVEEEQDDKYHFKGVMGITEKGVVPGGEGRKMESVSAIDLTEHHGIREGFGKETKMLPIPFDELLLRALGYVDADPMLTPSSLTKTNGQPKVIVIDDS